MTKYLVLGIVLTAAGLFSIVCAVKEAKWFFNNSRARPIVEIFGFKFAKLFYILLGLIFVLLAFVPIWAFFRNL